MAGLASVPLSACAILSSKMAECATPQTQSQCDHQMNMDEGAAKVAAAPNGSCCSLSDVPTPATQEKAFELSVAAAPVVVLDIVRKVPGAPEQQPEQVEQALAPPPLQSLLCTFLI